MAFATTGVFSGIIAIPIALPQLELRRGKAVQIAQFELKLGQVLELRSLNLHLIKVLTPGVVPAYVNRSLGFTSLGVYQGSMLTSALALVKGYQIGVTQLNPWASRRLVSPGTYTVVVSNNTSNCDVAVCAAGSFKLYL